MRNRLLLIIVVVLSIILLTIDSSSHTTFFNSKSNKIKVKNTKTENIDLLNLEEYIIGVVSSEMPASFNEEALKAQAIASRTYAVYKINHSNGNYDVVTDVSNQGYITIDEMKNKWKDDFDKYYNKIKNAVESTKGKIMYYNDEVIESFYFAMSNGYTEDVSLVFNEEKDYLKSVESSYDTSLNNFKKTVTFTKEEICSKLDIECNELVFSNIERSNTNRVNSITVNGKMFKGTIFRSKLGLRSTDFEIVNDNNNIYITTKGYGHGVGMSQYGANGMALDGYKYDEILKYYYKDVKIGSI